jgi:hypothetical protein
VKLVEQGKIEAELIFVSKYFHVDYALIEKNLRRVLERAIRRYPGRVILVYGDLCLGMDNEMKKLADEYDVTKIDALNCIDCQLGGKGKFLEADPNHDLIFLSPGMTDFFHHMKEELRREGIDENSLNPLFKGLRGIVLLDTLGEPEKLKTKVARLESGLQILDIKEIGIENVYQVILKAFRKINSPRN